MLTDRLVGRYPFCLPTECLKPEHSLPSSHRLRLPCWLGWRAHGRELQALPTAVLVRLSREVRAAPATQSADLPVSWICSPGQTADVRMAVCLSVNREPPLSFSFQFLLGFLPLLHWCGCCFLATICVTCMSWPYLTGG